MPEISDKDFAILERVKRLMKDHTFPEGYKSGRDKEPEAYKYCNAWSEGQSCCIESHLLEHED